MNSLPDFPLELTLIGWRLVGLQRTVAGACLAHSSGGVGRRDDEGRPVRAYRGPT